MVGERLGRGLHEEGQEGQLGTVLGKERILRTRTQRGNLRHVDLDDRGQLSRGLQRLDHTAGDRLTQARHLFGRATQRRRLADSGGRCGGSRRCCRSRGCRDCGASGSCGSLDVLTANATANTGARHGSQIDAKFTGELANDRGDVGGAGHGDRGLNDRSGGSRLGQRRRVRERVNRSGRRCGCGRSNRCSGCGLSDGSSRGSGRRNNCDDRTDLNGLIFGHADLCEETGDGGGDLGIDLVRGDLEQRLIGVNGVAHGLQPRGDGALGDRLAQSGHADLGALCRGASRSFDGCRNGGSRCRNGGGGRSSGSC